MRSIVRVVLAVLVGGFMLLDGSYARATQTYIGGVTGPWAGIVHLLGISAHSTLMYDVFIVYGLFWLLAIVMYLLKQRQWLFVASVLTLWYVPAGAILSLLILGSYLGPQARV